MSTTTDLVKVRCTCGARLTAPITAVGMSRPCPKCGQTLTVPSATEADLGAEPEQMDYSMGRGIVRCIIAGVVAAAIWVIISLTVGGMALFAGVVGIACGFAMASGTRRRAPEVGILAGGITFGCILLAKVAAVVLVIAMAAADPEVQAQARDSEESALHAMLLSDELQANEDADLDEASEAAKAKAQNMTPAQKQQYVAQKEAQAQKEEKAWRDSNGGSGNARAVAEAVGAFALFMALFGMWDILAIAGGIGLAYAISTYNDVT